MEDKEQSHGTPGQRTGDKEQRRMTGDMTEDGRQGTVRHVTGNDKDYLRLIPRVVW